MSDASHETHTQRESPELLVTPDTKTSACEEGNSRLNAVAAAQRDLLRLVVEAALTDLRKSVGVDPRTVGDDPHE